MYSTFDLTCPFYTCSVSCATSPLAPLSDLLPLVRSSVLCFFCWCFCLRFCGCLLFGLCVPTLVLWASCLLFLLCCGRLPSPAGCCLPPLRLFPCGVLVQLLCWSLPLGIWLLHVTARLPCPNAWGVVVLCFLASSCFMAAKAFGPVWGFVLPSTPWCMCCCCALYSYAEVFILG